MSDISARQLDEPGRYEIRVQGRLADRWATWFDGMTLTAGRDGSTVLEGPVVDQTALHGLLHKVRDIGLPLLSVTRLGDAEPTCPPRIPARPTQEPDMTTIVRTAAPARLPVDSTRKTARTAGAFYLITFAASIPALFLLGPVLNNPDYIVSAGADTGVLLGCFLDVITALAGIGSAVTLFSVLKRQHEGFALGFVTTRLMEGAVIMIGVVCLLSVVTLRQNPAGADHASLVAVGHSLVAVRDETFLLGPNLMAGLNALLLGTLMRRSGLVPRLIPTVGLVGGVLLLIDVTAIFFGGYDLGSVWHGIASAPIFVWELSLGVWMLVKGFKSAPIGNPDISLPVT
ncbi:MAG: hypothetical protein QOE51_1898 [Actinoplanes sp.]|jgi:hypothetical protein|nr:hypothetical protein [Actinoplanes sp.]